MNGQSAAARSYTGNLDRKAGEEIAGLLKELNQYRGGTVVLVTHNQALAQLV
jgi:predicted ABC-type transport system involved in lysophospholipase L1 biosynthesis ATPase subunit